VPSTRPVTVSVAAGAPAAAVMNELAARLSPLLEDVLGPRAWITSVQALALYPAAASAMSEADEARLVAGSLHSDYPYGEFKEGMDGLAAARPQTPARPRRFGCERLDAGQREREENRSGRG